jgi:hypothetical protein
MRKLLVGSSNLRKATPRFPAEIAVLAPALTNLRTFPSHLYPLALRSIANTRPAEATALLAPAVTARIRHRLISLFSPRVGALCEGLGSEQLGAFP